MALKRAPSLPIKTAATPRQLVRFAEHIREAVPRQQSAIRRAERPVDPQVRVPLYLLADNCSISISCVPRFSFCPVTSLLDLPPEAAVALAGGVLINIYAGIAFAAPLDLSPYQWTVLAVFLGVCHSMIVESAIMAKLGISYGYSISLRGFWCLPDRPPGAVSARLPVQSATATRYTHPAAVRRFLADALPFPAQSRGAVGGDHPADQPDYRGHGFAQGEPSAPGAPGKGQHRLLDHRRPTARITYGAGILIREASRGALSREDIFFIGTFLMICHSIVEDVLLFVLFGAIIGLYSVSV
jgi:hypothetical protein